ncbi:hypothetical protein EDB81DRAFT_927800 [Dactylonectria macrodidyma]|uniref:Cupin type-2 domain-containing protein n=1 Tax=Dactylonectria macrodidyma TaxID=307937 RepID=A0A9P9F8X4_9HYPO|nr:hypothetical protein EDB81DRAFT_927800 [Dactylonectria macrodidyma]
MTAGRVVTTVVNDKGLGVFESDQTVELSGVEGGGRVRRYDVVDKVPVPDIAYNPKHQVEGLATSEGAAFMMVELPAGFKSPMHATPSMDYGVMVSGEIVLMLDSGEETILRAGDVYVQKGAAHMWENRSSEVARFTVTLLASRP